MTSVTVRCFAKINLTLEILGRRPDGYHELRTVFQSVSLADEVRLEPGPQSRHPTVTMVGSPAPLGMDLCDRAVQAFRQRYGWPGDITIGLHKHIPVGAGLGGGSADAAATLRGLAALHGDVPPKDLADLAAGLGSDVPFFLIGGTCLGCGRGERLELLPPLTEGLFIIATPGLSISTREAYGLLGPEHYSDGARTEALVAALHAGCALRELAPCLYNGFAPVVEERWPRTRALRERLLSFGAGAALLSGSGAAVFASFDTKPEARAALDRLQGDGTWATLASPVARGLDLLA